MDAAADGINTIVEGERNGVQHRVEGDDHEGHQKNGVADDKYLVPKGGLGLPLFTHS